VRKLAPALVSEIQILSDHLVECSPLGHGQPMVM